LCSWLFATSAHRGADGDPSPIGRRQPARRRGGPRAAPSHTNRSTPLVIRLAIRTVLPAGITYVAEGGRHRATGAGAVLRAPTRGVVHQEEARPRGALGPEDDGRLRGTARVIRLHIDVAVAGPRHGVDEGQRRLDRLQLGVGLRI